MESHEWSDVVHQFLENRIIDRRQYKKDKLKIWRPDIDLFMIFVCKKYMEARLKGESGELTRYSMWKDVLEFSLQLNNQSYSSFSTTRLLEWLLSAVKDSSVDEKFGDETPLSMASGKSSDHLVKGLELELLKAKLKSGNAVN